RGAKAVGDSLVAPADPEADPVAARAAATTARATARPAAEEPDRPLGPEPASDARPSNRAPSPVPMSQTIWSGQDGPRDSLGLAASATSSLASGPGGALEPIGA